ncbi:NUDIX domain-containing protein [Tropicimonas sp. TH_r6]|uniref:NUDIX domain-containing protein n=1 Tax=Tropicimonas sp. TH_r6 TaxID=3082085 RepID=UPI002952F6C6|nr:NUDIX domain-containing protein [Tropicimonas sp. TH_r6]MDV7145324.1 NUDIX domain-containing protein [Tropicimonas sp. TH_r6]
MTRELLLLQSGKGVRNWHGPQRARPLRDGGKRQAQRIGTWLAGQGHLPGRVIAAPSERAFVTAQKALKAAGLGARGLERAASLGKGSAKDVAGLLGGCATEDDRVMLVLDGKAMRALLATLFGRRAPEAGTGSLFRLALPDAISDLTRGSARLLETVRPEDLPEKFPFDGPTEREWRDRPAYYYSQSAVLPYRPGADGIEILLIGSSKRNHWVVPKGIHEPGYSARASAGKEAEEEAGIFGEIGPDPIGHFEIAKWGATCRVALYPMKVTRQLEMRDWEESHRSRLWVSPEGALLRLKDDGLRRLVAEFTKAPPGEG